jgi:predicted aldo/keto reductase-like oxidoreductase
MHSVGNGGMATFRGRYIDNGALDFLVEQRAAGRIRNLGFSFHGDPKVFEWCMENHGKYKWDFCQIQMNYVDWLHAKEVNPRNLSAKYLYETLAAKGIPAIVMEPLLGGRLARFNYAVSSKLRGMDPNASLASWAFRFCGTYPNVLTILSGMTYQKFVEENVATFSPLKPLSAKELETLEEAAVAMLQDRTVPCNLCQYCMPCPYGIDIPAIFIHYNKCKNEGTLPRLKMDDEYWKLRRQYLIGLDRAVPRLRQADHCIQCGQCEPHCPQNIRIPRELNKISQYVEALRQNKVDDPEGKK